jgi:RNA polymerase sigma-70 factor (ECF subfamily)
MAAVRLSVSAHRAENRVAGLADSYAANIALVSDIELSFIRGRYEADFVAALRDAMATLDAEQRMLLQFCYREELTSDQIAAMLKASRATAHRRVVAARDALGAALREKLRARLVLSESGLSHLLGLLSSRLVPALAAELREGLR